MAEVKQMNNMAITIDDGSRRIAINNTNGEEVGSFVFHPTDMGIVERYNKMVSEFDTITEPLQEVFSDENVDNEKQIAALKEAEKRMYEAVNKLFNADAATAFFGKMSPFSPVNGAFYAETVLQSLGAFISDQFNAETEKFSKRVEKYTKGVKKK